jgi:hypothetical protein
MAALARAGADSFCCCASSTMRCHRALPLCAEVFLFGIWIFLLSTEFREQRSTTIFEGALQAK